MIKLTKGMKVKDLPEYYQSAFNHIPTARPNVGFRNGKFHEIIWFVYTSYWVEIPWGSYLKDDFRGGIKVSTASKPVHRVREDIAKLMMGKNPKGGFDYIEKISLEKEARELMWC